MKTALFLLGLGATAALFPTLGCSAGGATSTRRDQTTGTGTGGTGDLFGNGGNGSNPFGSGGAFDDFGNPIGGGPDNPDAACKALSSKAEKRLGGKADIIWVLDNSGSMLPESQGVQNNMNAFSQFITGTGIDVHVVVVSSTAPLLVFIPPYGVCVQPPLGTGQCPADSNPPVFTHILQEVDSHNALQQLMNTYPQWQGAIRPDATKTFVVVTDDEANPAPTPADFTNFFNQQFAGSTWRFSGVFCKGPAANCSGIGNAYTSLVDGTHGLWADMGDPNMNWQAIFQQLGDAVVADAKPVDCEYVIPPPPDGQKLDPDLVNVNFIGSNGQTQSVFGVEQAACTDKFLGWYFDNPAAPTKILACPTTCPVLQADQGARVDVLFGCEKKHPPLM